MRAAVAFAAAVAAAVSCAPSAVAAGQRAPLVVFDANFVQGKTVAERTASYRRLRAMGAEAVRLDFNWVSLEPVGPPLHDYVWKAQDREVRAIRRAGLKVLGILAYGHPDYSRAGGDAYRRGQKPAPPFGIGDPQYYPPDDPASFARFASDVAKRYREDVMGWEVWNEENGGWRFWEPQEDPAAYGRLLCAARKSLRRVDPDAPVSLGGMFFPPLGGILGTGAVKFLGQVLDAGGSSVARCFDAVAYHPYPYPFTSPEARVRDRGSVIDAADQLRRVLRPRGLVREPLWNTEVGWPTNSAGNGVTEARQARYTARLSLLSWARRVPLVTWYTWGDYDDPGGTNQEAHFGFFRVDGSAKPSYRALVALRQELGGSGWRYVGDRSRALGLPRGSGGVDRGYALQFAGPRGRRVLALWYANERPPTGVNPLAPVEPGTPAASIPIRVRVGGRRIQVLDIFGRRRAASPSRSGVLRLRAGQDPIYVTWCSRSNRLAAR